MVRHKHNPVPRLLVLALTATALSPGAAQPQQQQQQERPVQFRAPVHTVLVDVLVSTDNGMPVQGLTAADFRVTENGAPQVIQSVQFIEPPSRQTAQMAAGGPTEAGPRQAGEKPTQKPSAEALQKAADSATQFYGTASVNEARKPRHWVLVISRLASQFSDIQRVKDQAKRFVRQVKGPNDFVMVIDLGLKPKIANRFSRNPEELEKTIGKISGAPYNFEAGVLKQNLYVATVDAIRAIAEYLAGLKTEKILVLAAPPFGGRGFGIMQQAVRALTAANVRVYTLDSSGGTFASQRSLLEHQTRNPINPTADINVFVSQLEREALSGLGKDVPGGAVEDRGGADNVLARSKDLEAAAGFSNVPEALAAMTGGRFFTNTVNLIGALRRVEQETSGYYLLSYAPTNTDFRGEWRSIGVQVLRPDVRVRARRGYFATP
ncbi:MAG: VWA domain-containing protein [Acidobacteriota bacterium]